MTARAHARTPSAAVPSETRLPWWGVALPVLAFVVLLTLLASGGQSQGDSSAFLALSEVVERLQRAVAS